MVKQTKTGDANFMDVTHLPQNVCPIFKFHNLNLTNYKTQIIEPDQYQYNQTSSMNENWLQCDICTDQRNDLNNK